jgi:CubicO group peptidase (beta-lactamase class C family)
MTSRFPTNPVTLRELLCHRAGMVPHGFLGSRERAKALSSLEVLKRREPVVSWLSGHYLGTIKVIQPPGSRFRYSGGGYCVVQKAVEDVTGESFDLAISRLLLQPLGMNRSHFRQPPSSDDARNAARGYGFFKSLLFPGPGPSIRKRPPPGFGPRPPTSPA